MSDQQAGSWSLLERAKARVRLLEAALLIDQPETAVVDGRSFLVIPIRTGLGWSSVDVLNDAANALVELAALAKGAGEDSKASLALIRAAEVLDACLELERKAGKET